VPRSRKCGSIWTILPFSTAEANAIRFTTVKPVVSVFKCDWDKMNGNKKYGR
jgi:hypothetical protein